ncbi:conserved hypothetical protein [Desulforamulus reducens MI-1]|uniref:DUF2680 domain-containing protein n=1 Tax=Desulforamulus reducens (strain ATCC BAA-1160 / DSM 100696 / MI-1) TaxID=349161 RepID=A4J7N2_DESRM|nr:DUF2680 domain-containing protein [Desulforamulus reducens]ABO51085.1 conserved hypothetical protein [Desulforamulus reducens MI-1]
MNKRLLLIGLLILSIVALSVPIAFAADDSTNAAKTWFEQRMTVKKAWVDQAVKDGTLTTEQGQAWKKHFDEVAEFRAKNGFVCPAGGPGSCGMGPGRGMGNGFGGGGRWMNNPPAAQVQ